MKNLLTHLDKGCRNAHPFLRFSKKNFYSVKRPPHLFGIAKPNDTLFHRKNEKMFFSIVGALFLLPSKSLFTYSHWEQPNAHPESRKIFTLRLFGIERSKRTLFFRKNNLKRSVVSKYPPTCSHWQRTFGDVNLKKQKQQELSSKAAEFLPVKR